MVKKAWGARRKAARGNYEVRAGAGPPQRGIEGNRRRKKGEGGGQGQQTDGGGRRDQDLAANDGGRAESIDCVARQGTRANSEPAARRRAGWCRRRRQCRASCSR